MKVTISYPSTKLLNDFLVKEETAPFTYKQIGATKENAPVGFDDDHNSIFIGEGQAAFAIAKCALQTWEHFPPRWTKIYTPKTPPYPDQTVVVLFKLFGLWWLNSARIVYFIDSPNKFGFAYGTLTGHIEMGEEVFYIELMPDGRVFYHIKAFSKPRHWLVKLGYPVARYYQRQFVQESLQLMKNVVHENQG